MAEAAPKITVMQNGPYQVLGNVPLVRKTPVKSDQGEAKNRGRKVADNARRR